MSLNIVISEAGVGTFKVKLIGMLDTDTAGQLDARMADFLADRDIRALQMELHDLTYISSMGLGSFSKIRKALAAKGGTMVVIGAQPQITKVFEIVKMLPKETIFASVAEADEYLAAIQNNVIEEGRPAPQA